MAGKQAKILTDGQLDRLLGWCDGRRYPLRDRVVVLLSAKAGLRAMEIARICRRHVTDADGVAGETIHLEDKLCKMGSGRLVPMADALRRAIARLLALDPHARPDAPLVASERGVVSGRARGMGPASIANLFATAYCDLGLQGCSSHSGRRTFITRIARSIFAAGGSLRDVQQLAGHSNLSTTQRYIEGDADAKRRVVDMI